MLTERTRMIRWLRVGFSMRYQHTKVGGYLLGLAMLSGCVSTPPPNDPLAVPCPAISTNALLPVSQDPTSQNKNQAMMTQALQKRLQESERTIAAQSQQIDLLSSQLEALKQIDRDTHRQPRKRLVYPIP